jgi:hypothetical protein
MPPVRLKRGPEFQSLIIELPAKIILQNILRIILICQSTTKSLWQPLRREASLPLPQELIVESSCKPLYLLLLLHLLPHHSLLTYIIDCLSRMVHTFEVNPMPKHSSSYLALALLSQSGQICLSRCQAAELISMIEL